MVDNEQLSNDVLTWPNIYFAKPSQMATTGMEDVAEDADDDDIDMKMNKQVPLEDLSPTKLD